MSLWSPLNFEVNFAGWTQFHWIRALQLPTFPEELPLFRFLGISWKPCNIVIIYWYKKVKCRFLTRKDFIINLLKVKDKNNSRFVRLNQVMSKEEIVSKCYDCYYHVTYAFQSESTLHSYLNVKEPLAENRRGIWSLSEASDWFSN